MSDEAVPLLVRADLARLFGRACEQLGRDGDDVLAEMLELFLADRRIAELCASNAPLSPPPGPVDDPTQPHAHPFCHNAHDKVRDRRLEKRVERIERRLSPSEARQQVDEARERRKARVLAIDSERAVTRLEMNERTRREPKRPKGH